VTVFRTLAAEIKRYSCHGQSKSRTCDQHFVENRQSSIFFHTTSTGHIKKSHTCSHKWQLMVKPNWDFQSLIACLMIALLARTAFRAPH
jgi:hypothetical protein